MYLASKEIQGVRSQVFHGFHNTQAQGNYTNDVVEKLSQELGIFDYGEYKSNSSLEFRSSVVLESGATYKG